MSKLRPACVLLLGLAACGLFTWEHAVRSEATDDLHCADENIVVTEESWAAGHWRAEGCGAEARYQCWMIPHGGPHCRRIDSE
ncbi:MAG TPA: hypothetical protein VIY73_13760 [Polyangiaceae bacterium]|jgi:hypothetical protein